MKQSEVIEQRTCSIIQIFLKNTRPESKPPTLSSTSSLERDLSLGSIERAELFHRLEATFDIKLPEYLLGHVDTIGDLAQAIEKGQPPEAVLKLNSKDSLPISKVDVSAVDTLIDALHRYVTQEPNRPHIYLQDEYGKESILSYGSLWKGASNVVQYLTSLGVRPGDKVAIMLPTSKHFFFAFIGVWLAGCVPVPIYPPLRANQLEEYAKRETFILSNAEVRILITFARAERLSQCLKSFVPSLIKVITLDGLKDEGSSKSVSSVSGQEALIQYTSGSTGNPKGVLLSHGNLITNIRTFGKTINIQPSDVVVSWLPLYHDMGLIGAWLGSLYHGIPLISSSPLSFLLRPKSWLWNIHYHRATISVGPNFAYELCLKKVANEDIEGLDLSSWRLALNGAEAISPKTLQRFYQRFSPCGFRKETLFPVYGLAESTVGLVFPPVGRPFKVDRISHEHFVEEQSAIPVTKMSTKVREFVSCGRAMPEHEIRITDTCHQSLPERVIGNIEFRGPSTMQGYYANANATQAICHDGWWETGDLGYIADGELYVTGRKKDLIIKAGRNYSPEEIEEVTASISGIRKGCVVAFGIQDPRTGTERIIIVAETSLYPVEEAIILQRTISQNVTEKLGVPPDEVLLVPPRTVLKTSSGKLRRSSLKEQYTQGKLGQRGLPVWYQYSKLFIKSVGCRLGSWTRTIGRGLYGIYAALVLMITMLPAWIILMVTPQRIGCMITRVWARNYLRLVGCPLRVKGREYLENYTQPTIFVANHASYVDTLALLATLKHNVAFVGKKELSNIPFLRSLIKKLGHLTIERGDPVKHEKDAEMFKACLAKSKSIFLFPEGTFTYAAGVRPFKLGAFLLAAQTTTSLAPVALSGTRKVLRAYSLPRPGTITLTFLEQLEPQASAWEEAVRLCHEARRLILPHSGEQSLDVTDASIPTRKYNS